MRTADEMGIDLIGWFIRWFVIFILLYCCVYYIVYRAIPVLIFGVMHGNGW